MYPSAKSINAGVCSGTTPCSHVSLFRFSLTGIDFPKACRIGLSLHHSFTWPSRLDWIDFINAETPHRRGAGAGCDQALGGTVAEVDRECANYSHVQDILLYYRKPLLQDILFHANNPALYITKHLSTSRMSQNRLLNQDSGQTPTIMLLRCKGEIATHNVR
jgi:hypothetical protein